MALITCPECKKKISEAASRCPQCGFPLDSNKVKEIKKETSRSNWLVIIIATMLIFGLFDYMYNRDSTNRISVQQTTLKYDILKKESLSTVENYNILVNPGTYSKKNIAEIVNAIEKKECKKQCTIFLWDNKEAYSKDTARIMEGRVKAELLTKGKISKKEYERYIKNQNASEQDCFIAQHLYAWKLFDTSTVWLYPLKNDLKGTIKKTCKFRSLD